jgi:hypothetical protein
MADSKTTPSTAAININAAPLPIPQHLVSKPITISTVQPYYSPKYPTTLSGHVIHPIAEWPENHAAVESIRPPPPEPVHPQHRQSLPSISQLFAPPPTYRRPSLPVVSLNREPVRGRPASYRSNQLVINRRNSEQLPRQIQPYPILTYNRRMSHDISAQHHGSDISSHSDSNSPTQLGGGGDEETKLNHKMAERKRRKEMKELFDILRMTLPNQETQLKSSKGEVLIQTIQFIDTMKNTHLHLTQQVKFLRTELIRMNQVIQGHQRHQQQQQYHHLQQQAQLQQQRKSSSPKSLTPHSSGFDPSFNSLERPASK